MPPEDNPLRGWRLFGLATLTRTLWPREARTNPVMAYYSGRKRGRVAEDMMGLCPWGAALVLDLIALAYWELDPIGYGVLSSICLLFMAAVLGATMTGFHLRRSLASLPLEELLLTRLKPVEIVQGLSVRPIAVQAAAIFLNAVGHLAIVLFAVYFLLGESSLGPLGYALLAAALRWHLYGIAMELGAGMAVRAHLCLRNAFTASMRMLFDLTWSAAVLALMGVAVVLASFFVGCFCGPVAMVLVMILLFSVLVAETARLMASEAMDFPHFYPGEWWVRNDPGESREELRERTITTPWKPIPQRSGLWVRRFARTARDSEGNPASE